MKAEVNIHPIQAQVIRCLTFSPNARFSQLNILDVPTDQLNFHLKALIEANIVEKQGTSYQLTLIGKEFANRFDTDKVIIEKPAKITTLLVCSKVVKGQKYYLLQQRLKQPYFGYYGFFGGKIPWGSTPFETMTKELKEEAGLSAKTIKVVGLKHKRDYSPDGQLLEDKYFFIARATGLTGELIEEFEGGRNLWLTEKEIFKLDNLFDGVKLTLEMSEEKSFTFVEKKYTVSGF